MIQFNLLPDIKKEYVRAKRTKRLIVTGSALVSVAVVGITVMLFIFVHGSQKQHIKNLTTDISASANRIKSTEDLNTMLTVQNQLSLLPGLHAAKPATSRLFDYLTRLSPSTVVLTTVDLDTTLSTITIGGNADSLATVNRLVNNIKAARHTTSDAAESSTTFSSVATQLSGDNEGATFTIDMTYDPIIFDNTQTVSLTIGDGPASTNSGGRQ